MTMTLGEGQSPEAPHEDMTRRQLLGRGLSAGAVLSLGGVLAACGGSGGGGTPAVAGASSTPSTGVRGGRLRVGIVGNGTQETFNPALANSEIDLAHVVQVFEPVMNFDDRGRVQKFLIDEIVPNASLDEWTLRLPADVEFHNGKTVTAADVMYTYNFHRDPANGSVSVENLDNIARMQVLDARTLRIALKRPNRFFGPALADFHHGIMPAGTTKRDFAKPIGTGPFKVVSFEPGKRAQLVRHPNYWQPGKPYVDELELISITDPEARINALLSRQVDAIADVSAVRLSSIKSTPGFRIVENLSAAWMGNYMLTSGKGVAPFDDVRVRQALRLLVDRRQVAENVFLGHARLANDIYGPQDSYYPQLPQRTFDPERAKSLLKAAGHENLSVDLYTGDLTAGLLDYCTLFAGTAKQAGVTIRLHNQESGQYFSTSYLQKPFGATYWSGIPYYQGASQNLAATASINETAWRDPQWQRLFEQAKTAKDPATADRLLADSQRILYERGGYIIPVFPNFLDATTDKVSGLHASPVYPLGYFNFRDTSVKTKA